MAEILYDGEETGAGTRTVARQVDYGAQMYASGKADGARGERAAVVGWLRRQAERYELNPRFEALVTSLSNAIVAGEHRKEPDHG